jgi:hypothetical protein
MAAGGAGEKALTGTSPEAAALLDEAFGAEPGGTDAARAVGG